MRINLNTGSVRLGCVDLEVFGVFSEDIHVYPGSRKGREWGGIAHLDWNIYIDNDLTNVGEPGTLN